METEVQVAADAWASLLPDLLLDIFRRLETTAVIRCAAACKPWRRAIIVNASSLRPRPDRFNPNLLLGFFHHSWDDGVVVARWPPPQVVVSVNAVDMGHCERLSSLIPGVDLSSSSRILSSHDGLLLLQLRRGSNHDELCLCNPMAGKCTILPQSSIMMACAYTLLSGYGLSMPGTREEHGSVRILAKAGTDEDRLTYQVFSYRGDGGAGIWGPVQRSDEVNKGLRMVTYGRSTVVGRDAVYWLAGPRDSARHRLMVTCTVGLDIYTGRAWTTGLPIQCQFLYKSNTLYAALTTSGNGRLSVLQPLPDNRIQVWVLDGTKWTVQHRISIDVPNQRGDPILVSHYSNVVCPRSGFLFITLFSNLQLRINLDSRVRNPVQCIGRKSQCDYYPYEMDWSTYISKMKNF